MKTNNHDRTILLTGGGEESCSLKQKTVMRPWAKCFKWWKGLVRFRVSSGKKIWRIGIDWYLSFRNTFEISNDANIVHYPINLQHYAQVFPIICQYIHCITHSYKHVYFSELLFQIILWYHSYGVYLYANLFLVSQMSYFSLATWVTNEKSI